MATDFSNLAQGIDVSKWQRTVDWPAVKAAGVSFAFAKASEVTFVDQTFSTNWPGMKAVGLLRGAYHFFRPAQDPKKQGEFFARVLEPDPGELPAVLDVEGNDGVSNATMIKNTEICLNAIEGILGRKPIIYTRAGFWNQFMWDRPGHYPDWTANYPLWVAHYTSAAQPAIPKGWAKWDFWQFTESGSVSGVQGKVDQNRFNGTVAELLAWAGQEVPAPVADVVSLYFQALNAGDVDALLGLYQANLAHVTAAQTLSGLDPLRGWYQELLQKLPGAQWAVVESKMEGNSWVFTWTCTGPSGKVTDGRDTIGIRDGKIQYHNTLFTITKP